MAQIRLYIVSKTIDRVITLPRTVYRVVALIITFSTPLLYPFRLLVLFIPSMHILQLHLKAALTWLNWDTVIGDSVLVRIEPYT